MGSYTTFALTLRDDEVAFIRAQAAQRGITVSELLSALVQREMRVNAAHQPAKEPSR